MSFLKEKIYLASASPRRHEILNQLKIDHKILRVPSSAEVDEPQYKGELATDYVKRTAIEKAQKAIDYIKQHDLKNHPVLSADTCVILNGQVIDKAHTDQDVYNSLSQLSAQQHEVHTHLVLAYQDQYFQSSSINQVWMKQLTAEEIAFYVKSKEGIAKAGGYAIQGLGGFLIEKIIGSYTGVMGLPAMETWCLLKEHLTLSDYLEN